MNKILLAVLCVAALAVSGLLAGCGSGVQFVRQDITEYPPKAKDAEIEVFDGTTTQPFVVIGTMKAGKEMEASFGEGSTYEEVVESMKTEARKVGADALIHLRFTDTDQMKTRIDLTATAVRYLTQSTTVSSKAS